MGGTIDMYIEGKGRKKVECICEICEKKFTRRRDYINNRLKDGKPCTCTYCSNSLANKEKWKNYSPEHIEKMRKISSETMKRTRASESSDERSDRAKYARSCVKADPSETVRKQWETIKSNPDKYKKAIEHLTKISRDQWENLSPKEKEDRVRKCFSNGRRSTGSKDLHNELIKIGLNPEPERCVGGFFPDEIIYEYNLIIEFFGDMYHCHPDLFKDNDSFCPWISRTVGEQRKRDKMRVATFYQLGYKVVIIWEKDWKINKQAQIQRVLNEIPK